MSAPSAVSQDTAQSAHEPTQASDGVTDAALAAGARLFAQPITFVRGVVALDQLPPGDLPEVAVAGRSNVGKSSLINALANRKGLARASNEPGRTRELNFFQLNNQIHVVDLPGYGYARAPKAAVARWTGLTRDYLRGRAMLKRVFLLIDARRGLSPADAEIMSLLDAAAVVYQVTMTKIDKIRPADRAAVVDAVAAALARRPAAHPHVLATSAAKRFGLDEARAEIAALAAPPVTPATGGA